MQTHKLQLIKKLKEDQKVLDPKKCNKLTPERVKNNETVPDECKPGEGGTDEKQRIFDKLKNELHEKKEL